MKKPQKPKKERESPVTISDCHFQGIVWDGKAIQAIEHVAKALLNLTEVFKSQHIQIDNLLYVSTSTAKKEEK